LKWWDRQLPGRAKVIEAATVEEESLRMFRWCISIQVKYSKYEPGCILWDITNNSSFQELSSQYEEEAKQYLEEIEKKNQVAKINLIQEQVDQVQTMVQYNLSQVTMNMKTAEELLKMSEKLLEMAQVFRKRSKELKEKHVHGWRRWIPTKETALAVTGAGVTALCAAVAFDEEAIAVGLGAGGALVGYFFAKSSTMFWAQKPI
jgi:hypothetical protein